MITAGSRHSITCAMIFVMFSDVRICGDELKTSVPASGIRTAAGSGWTGVLFPILSEDSIAYFLRFKALISALARRKCCTFGRPAGHT